MSVIAIESNDYKKQFLHKATRSAIPTNLAYGRRRDLLKRLPLCHPADLS
jgi:hypothetical protein